MEIRLMYDGINIEITYDNEDGVLKHVKNLHTGKFMMIETKQEGIGYTIKTDNYLMKMDVCDARYVRIMELDIFIPRLMFIENKKDV